jgi:hypothetical protein
MMNKPFEELVKARDRLAASVRERPRQIQAVAAGGQQAVLAGFKARLQAATHAKERAIQRYDEEIRYYTELVAELETAIDQSRAAETQTNSDDQFN